MKKRFAPCCIFILLMSLGAITRGGEATARGDYTPITLKLGTTSAESSIVAQAFSDWSKRLDKTSGGKVKMDVFFSSTLGSAVEMLQGAQMGIIDVVVQQPGGLADMGAKRMNLYSLPYLFDSYDQYTATLFGPIGEQLLQDVTDNVPGLVGFSYLPDSGRCYFTAKKQVRRLADIQGMKMRLQAFAIDTDTSKALGFSSTPVSFAELYSAIQTGVVDGGENSLASIDGNALYEVCKYLVLDEHIYNIPTLLVSKTTWNRISDDTKKLLKTTWMETLDDFFFPRLPEYNAELLEKFKKNGVEVTPRLEDREKWVEAVKPVWAKYGVGIEDLISGVQALKTREGAK